jgi:hypothetical protein
MKEFKIGRKAVANGDRNRLIREPMKAGSILR